MLYNNRKKNDPIEVAIQSSRKKIVRVKDTNPQAVLKVYLIRYEEYAGSKWMISKTEKQKMIMRIRKFEKGKNMNVDHHCEMVNFLFDSVFKPGFNPSLGAIVSNYFYNLWKSKPSSKQGKFRKTSKKKFEEKVKKSSGDVKRFSKRIKDLKKNGLVK